jgi:hypothetical protein
MNPAVKLLYDIIRYDGYQFNIHTAQEATL